MIFITGFFLYNFISLFGQPVLIKGADFVNTTAKGNFLIRFFAPWCPKCRRMEPEFNKVAAAGIPNVTVANVDCQADNKLCLSLGIDRYPRIRFHRDGNLVATYALDFNAIEMREFGVKLSTPPIQIVRPNDLLTILDKEISRSSLILIGSEINSLYSKLAQANYNTLTPFYFVLHFGENELNPREFDALFAKLNITNIEISTHSSLLLAVANGTQYIHSLELKGTTTYESLQLWFSVRQYAFLTHFSVALGRQAVGLGKKRKMVVGMVNGTTSVESTTFLEAYKQAALKHFENEDYFFVIVDTNRFPGFAEVYNISSSDSIPDFFVINWETSTNWTSHLTDHSPLNPHPKSVLWTRDRMLAFLEGVVSGRVAPSEHGGAHFNITSPTSAASASASAAGASGAGAASSHPQSPVGSSSSSQAGGTPPPPTPPPAPNAPSQTQQNIPQKDL